MKTMASDTPIPWRYLLTILGIAALLSVPATAQAALDGYGRVTDASHNDKHNPNPNDDEEEDDTPGKDENAGPPGRAGSLIKWDQRTFTVFESAGEVVLSVERFHGDEGQVVVEYWTEDGTAVEGEDYVGVSGSLTWEDGEDDRRTVALSILDDEEFEVRETVELHLAVVDGDAQLHPGHGFAILQIMDASEDDGEPGEEDPTDPGRVEFSDDELQALEGETARIAVERKGGGFGAVSVAFATVDGSAVAGDDYEETSGVLMWDDGEKGVRTFEVPVLEDDLEEGNESLLLELSDPTGGVALEGDGGVAELVVLDDDGSTAACVADADTLCLSSERFQIEVDWRANGKSGFGTVEEVSDDSGLVWFFRRGNKEMLIKVLDACDDFGTYWVFFAATTNVDFTVTVTDTATGIVKEYTNTAGRPAEPVQDTFTFKTCGGD